LDPNEREIDRGNVQNNECGGLAEKERIKEREGSEASDQYKLPNIDGKEDGSPTAVVVSSVALCEIEMEEAHKVGETEILILCF
jgi:hypothetical protein